MVKVHIEKIGKSAELISSISQIAKTKDLGSSWIVGALGALEDIEIGIFIPDEGYKHYKIDGPMELVSSQGNISSDGEVIHLHCCIGDGSNVWAGHLFSAKVALFVELCLLKTDFKIERREVGEGLKEMVASEG